MPTKSYPRSLLVIPLAGLVLVSNTVGCGSSEPASAGSATTVSGYCEAWADIACEALAPCCGMEPPACVSSLESTCLEQASHWEAEGMEFDPMAAQACLDSSDQLYEGCSLRSADDTEYQQAQALCLGVFAGALPLGAECADDLACRSTNETKATCVWRNEVSVCESSIPVEPGASCLDPASRCSAGFYCSRTDATCQPQKLLGTACEEEEECRSFMCEESRCWQPSLEQTCEQLASSSALGLAAQLNHGPDHVTLPKEVKR